MQPRTPPYLSTVRIKGTRADSSVSFALTPPLRVVGSVFSASFLPLPVVVHFWPARGAAETCEWPEGRHPCLVPVKGSPEASAPPLQPLYPALTFVSSHPILETKAPLL